MSIDVTSWFYSQATAKIQTGVIRKCFIESDDVSDRVIKWPSVAQDIKGFRAPRGSMVLANNDNHFTYFVNSEPTHYQTCAVEYGYTHPTSGDELTTIIKGNVDAVDLRGGKCNLTIRSRFAQLEDGVIGSPDSSQTYSGSPDDITWDVLTVQNSLDTTQDVTNPDIHYASFSSWSWYWGATSIYMESEFDGVRATEILKKMAEYTQSAIYVQDDKIRFSRLAENLTGSLTIHLDESNTISDGFRYSKTEKVNKMTIYANYDVTSNGHQITVDKINSADISSYGVFQKNFKDRNLWFTNSIGALTMANKILGTKKEMKPSINLKAPIFGIIPTIGDVVGYENALLGVDSDTYFVTGYKIDMDKLETELTIDKAYFLSQFTLNVSSLGGDDRLG